MSFKIGNIEIKNNIVLAPMAGISNPTYIKLCEGFGLGFAVTELISAEAIVRDNKKTLDMLKGIDEIKIPVAVQLFGSNPQTLANAAKKVIKLYNVKIIDINMGCPVPKIAVKSQAGSALLKDPDKIYEIVKIVKESISVPVTVKIRSGWDENSINAPLVAKLAEKAGASAITIHARTRKEGYSGHSDWNLIKKVKDSVNIPVIGNGDVHSCYDAKQMLESYEFNVTLGEDGKSRSAEILNAIIKAMGLKFEFKKIPIKYKEIGHEQQDCALFHFLDLDNNPLFRKCGIDEAKLIKQCESTPELFVELGDNHDKLFEYKGD